MSADYTLSLVRYRCGDCGHRGPARLTEVVDADEFWGAPVERVTFEASCEKCGGDRVTEEGGQ